MKRNVKRHAVTQPLDQSIKFIALTKDQTMKVSAHRYAQFMEHNWHVLKRAHSPGYYAVTKIWENRRYHTIYAHRFALGLEEGHPLEGDHINHDTLDNRDENLRKATRAQQLQNTPKRRNNTSGHKGVTFYKRRNLWRVCLNVERKHKHIGYFSTYEAAVRAAIEAADKYFGEFACV